VAFDLDDAHLGPGMSLIVVERNGRAFRDFEVRIAGDAGAHLAEAWEATVEAFASAEHVPYTPEVVIRAGEGGVLVIDEDLGDENEIVEVLLDDVDRPVRVPQDVNAERLYLYAVLSTTDTGRIAAIKKQSPAKRARAGKRWALAHDELVLMEEDPWQLHPIFDMLVAVDGAYAVSVSAFEQLFAEADRLVEKVDDWVQTVAAALPMDADQQDVLIDRSRESSRVRRRLRSIVHRGHLTRVSVGDVRRHVGGMGLPVAEFVHNDRLVVERANVDQLLQVLNEDLFVGGLTGDRFRSEGKGPCDHARGVRSRAGRRLPATASRAPSQASAIFGRGRRRGGSGCDAVRPPSRPPNVGTSGPHVAGFGVPTLGQAGTHA
jgi:hypothetical protein